MCGVQSFMLVPTPPARYQLQRRLLHIHCSGASLIHASNCSCMWTIAQRMSSDWLAVRGTRNSLSSISKRLSVPMRLQRDNQMRAV